MPDYVPCEQLIFDGIGSVPSDRYGVEDSFGRLLGLESAGPLAIMTKDQLHPPFVDDATIWADGSRWHEGAQAHVTRAAEHCDIAKGDCLLDIGAGLGGPARQIATHYGATVIAVNKVGSQASTASGISDPQGKTEGGSVRYVIADADRAFPFASASVDVAWSMNMLYHLTNHSTLIAEAARVVKPGGRIMIDDWMYTPRSNASTVQSMKFHFGSCNLTSIEAILETLFKNHFSVSWLIDLGYIARSHMTNLFSAVMTGYFRPKMSQLDPSWGTKLADDFHAAIEETVKLYNEETLTYVQLVAVRQG